MNTIIAALLLATQAQPSADPYSPPKPVAAVAPAEVQTPEALALAAAKSIERSYQHVVHVVSVGVDHDKYDKHRLLQIAFWSNYARDRVREASNATAALSPDRHLLNIKANQAIGTLFHHARIGDMLHVIQAVPKRGAATPHSHRR